MQNFIFKSPTEFIFGKEAENQTGSYLKKIWCKKSISIIRRKEC